MIIDLQHRSWLLIFIFLSIFLYLAAVIWGSVYISPSEILNILLGKSTDISNTGIIFKVRIPEATTAAFAGAGLSVAGLLMQTLFRNPLAGPSILGISSGASLGVAFFLLYMGGSIQNLSKGFLTLNRGVPLVFFATAGAIGISLVLLAFSSIVKDNVVLLIIGILISNLTLSLVSIWQSFSNPEAIQDYLMWTFGSLGSCRELSLFILCAIIIFGLFLSFLIFKPLNSLLLGEDYSASLGVNIAFLRIGILFITALLTGSITAFCGPIAFVGMISPHIVKTLFSSSDHKLVIPGSIFCGAAILLLCDIASRLPGSYMVLPINSVTALFSAPILIFVLLKKKRFRI